MTKNKFKVTILLLVVLILATFVPNVYAENEITDDLPVTTQEQIMDNENPTTEASDVTDTMKKSDVYITGNEVTIDYIVDGNLFVVANKVTIDSQIGGDAFICAREITITEQGYIYSNLFAVAETINIEGVVYDVYAVANTVNVSGYVYRNLQVVSATFNLSGIIGRDAHISSDNINFLKNENVNVLIEQGTINGNLNYYSKNEASIPENTVIGEVKFEKSSGFDSNSTTDYLLSLGTVILNAVMIWLLLLWLAPKFLKNTNKLLLNKILPVIGLGILAPIVLTIISIILLILGLTAPFGMLTLGTLFLLMAISTSIFIITINNIVCDKFKIEKNIVKFATLIGISIVLWLICEIPYIGAIISILVVLIGLGIIVSNLILKNIDKTKKEKK